MGSGNSDSAGAGSDDDEGLTYPVVEEAPKTVLSLFLERRRRIRTQDDILWGRKGNEQEEECLRVEEKIIYTPSSRSPPYLR